MTRLSITVSDHPRFSVVSLTGDLDKPAAPPLEEALTALLTRGHVRIIIDTTELGFCDSTGVWVLLATMRRAYEQNGWLRLAGVNGFLGRILELTRLRAAFPIDRDVDEALRRLAEKRNVPVPR
ncbi:STAS domain-containing protein [Streptosporangium sp. NBC_01756]|uniref:STAS domain-containing protein n=1 Tax=Streptosporangium sp. NBC_01756 TaxID=2975950 RepID=UPI002DDB0C72|nr:STAS domain-containing protein [Streptosporangium sp. NBC_01756]WSC88337.1 STAS domain-containing protein [Streptosporangium sp. NBC_01756]